MINSANVYLPPAPLPEPDEPLPLVPDVPVPVPLPLVPVPVPLPGVVLGLVLEPGGVMSGVPGVEGNPGVDGFPMPVPVPVPLLLPGAPVLVPASTPKCEYTRCIHVESIVGQLALLNVGALCSFARSTVTVNWSPLPWLINRQGMATRFPLVPVVP